MAHQILGRGEKPGQTALSTRRNGVERLCESCSPWDRVVSPGFSRCEEWPAR